MSKLLLVIDMQNDFIDGALGTKEAVSIVPYVKEVIDKITFGSMELPSIVSNISDLESITLIGLCTDICVISNAMVLKAFYPEVPIIVDAKACAGVTPESHKNALNAMKMCQIQVVNEE